MKDNQDKAIATAISAAIFLYLIFSFSTWELNPSNWHPAIRVFCATLSTFAIVIILINHNPTKK